MLMVFLMAALSLNLLPYTITNSYNGQRQLKHGYGLYINRAENAKSHFNASIFRPIPVTTKPFFSNETIPVKSMHRFKIKPGKKIIVKRHKIPPRHEDNIKSNFKVNAKTKRMSPKSDMKVLQFYAQPLNTYDVNQQQSFNTYEYDPPLVEYNSLNSPYVSLIPTVNPMTYKTLTQQFPNWNVMPATTEQPIMKSIPIYDPFNVFKRNPTFTYKVNKIRSQPLKKIVTNVKPISGTTISTVAPITVTHIYKYEESNSGLKLPFDNEDDPIVPVLSVAIDEHLHDRVANAGLKNYMIPPKLNQPIYYDIPTVLTLPTLNPPFNNDFNIINEFNAKLNSQTLNLQPRPIERPTLEYEEGKDDDRQYSDEDVEQALQYIKNRKKNKNKSRGSKKYESSENEHDKEPEKPKKKKKKTFYDEEIEYNENDDDEEEEFKRKKRKQNKKNEYIFEEDENYKYPISKHENQKNVIKADNDENVRYQETQLMPTINHEPETQSHPDFSQNLSLGDENSGDERVEFQMHGLQGPESYKFGYDTGKGENRQFRYEERDPDGKVKGHFGYYDKDGKLQIFHYEADPEHGYHLEKGANH